MPRKSVFRSVLLLAALSACVGQGARPSTSGAAAPTRGEHQNLQVLPDTISHDVLIAIMRNFTSALVKLRTTC